MPPNENLNSEINLPQEAPKGLVARNLSRIKGEGGRKWYCYVLFALVFAFAGTIIIHLTLASPSPDVILNSCTATACNGVAVGSSYIDPAQDSIKPPQYDFYSQPWRSYMQAVPAQQMLSGIGINYNPHNETAAQDAANLKYLASIGIHSIRLEMSWGTVDPSNENQFTADYAARYNGILAACKQYGITPTILLNANDGDPEPLYPTHTVQVVGTAAAGASQITVLGIQPKDIVVHNAGTGNGSSGLSLVTGGMEAANLITKVTPSANGTLTLTLSQPISKSTSGDVNISYFKYMPLYPGGTAEFNNTANGWLQYVKTVTNTVKAAGITNYGVEIWNEITNSSTFLDVDHYHTQLLPAVIPADFKPGGRAYELAGQTASYIKNAYGNNVKVIWGYTNTDQLLNPSKNLPAGIDGESYHPYWTQPNTAQALINDTKSQPENLVGGSYIPNVNIALPEGPLAALPITSFNLIGGKLAPNAVDTDPSPSFLHYMTENGQQPKDLSRFGFDDSTNQLYKAKALLRNYSFWLNKGVNQLDWYSAFDDSSLDDRGFNILAKGADTGGNPTTLQSRSLQNYTSKFAGPGQPTVARTPSVTVKDITPDDDTAQYQVFPANSANTEPALNYRQMFQFLPFQVSNNKFVISTYVMGWDITHSPPPMYFNLDIKDVHGNGATVSYYDPITDTSAPVTVVSKSSTDVVVNIQSVDYPRLLTIQEGQ